MGVLGKYRKDLKDIYSADKDLVREENLLLKNSVNYLKAELNKYKELPLLVCDVKKKIGNKAVIRLPNGSYFFVNIASDVEINSGDTALVEQRSLSIIKKMDENKNFDIGDFIILEKPNIKWDDIGGLDEQIKEIKEVVELPLVEPELFKKIGISPPKGILLYGPPGTGKTLLAKAVATSANCTFIEIVASELVQKFIGEGAKLVRDIFKLAREKAPSIVFIDEIDALAAERIDIGTSGEREVHRTMMQLLTEIDGFNSLDNVKIITATNRFDILDPALLRPGRFDRLIEIPLPDKESRLDILKIHAQSMNMSNVDFDTLINDTEGFSGADMKAVCTEAGYFAIREKRTNVLHDDFVSAIEKLASSSQENSEHVGMFG